MHYGSEGEGVGEEGEYRTHRWGAGEGEESYRYGISATAHSIRFGSLRQTFTIHLDCTNYFVKNQDPFYPDLQGTLCFGKDHRDYVTALVTHSAEGSYELVFNGALLEETNFKPFSFGEHVSHAIS